MEKYSDIFRVADGGTLGTAANKAVFMREQNSLAPARPVGPAGQLARAAELQVVIPPAVIFMPGETWEVIFRKIETPPQPLAK